MNFDDVRNKLKENSELRVSLEEAVDKKVDAGEVNAMLVEAGFDAEDADALAAEYQRRLGLAIADDDLDEEMLRKVAGGGSGIDCTQADDCDSNFKLREYWREERCIYQRYCDEEYEY